MLNTGLGASIRCIQPPVLVAGVQLLVVVGPVVEHLRDTCIFGRRLGFVDIVVVHLGASVGESARVENRGCSVGAGDTGGAVVALLHRTVASVLPRERQQDTRSRKGAKGKSGHERNASPQRSSLNQESPIPPEFCRDSWRTNTFSIGIGEPSDDDETDIVRIFVC